jgi:hypothetical protein
MMAEDLPNSRIHNRPIAKSLQDAADAAVKLQAALDAKMQRFKTPSMDAITAWVRSLASTGGGPPAHPAILTKHQAVAPVESTPEAADPRRVADGISEDSSIYELIDKLGMEFMEPVVRDLWNEARAAGISLEQFGQMRAAEIHTIFLARRTLAGVPPSDHSALDRLQKLLGTRGGRPRESCEIHGEKVKALRGDASQKAFCQRRHCNISEDVLQTAERGYATEKTIIKICKYAAKKGQNLTPQDLKKN